MGLATFRHNETGDLLELNEDWLDRFPNDPYTRVSTDDLAKLEIEQRQADAAAIGAQPYQQPDDGSAEAPAAAAAPTKGTKTEDEDTPPASSNPRSESRF